MKRSIGGTRFVALLTLLSAGGSIAGAAPLGTAFTYQGVLSSGGAAVNGPTDLTFTLYDAASGGSLVGATNVISDLVISNGVFTATLDFGAGAFNGTARWLEVAVRPGESTGTYTKLTPRQALTATPFALYSAHAAAPPAEMALIAAGPFTLHLTPTR